MRYRMLPIAFSPTDPRCHGNEIWDKIGYNLTCIRDFCKICAPIGGFRWWAIDNWQLHFSPTDPRCHCNESWDKIGYNSVCVGNFWKIFASIRGFSGMGHRMLTIALFTDWPRCRANEIWDKIGYNSACVKDICEIFAPIERGPLNAANCIFLIDTRCHGTKFGTKITITR